MQVRRFTVHYIDDHKIALHLLVDENHIYIYIYIYYISVAVAHHTVHISC